MVKVLVIDVKNKQEVRVVECNDYHDFYTELDCELFDIACREVDGVAYDIFVDDMGLYDSNPIVSCVDADFKPQLVGNLLIANHDGQGETVSLTDEDIDRIQSHIVDALIYDLSEENDKDSISIINRKVLVIDAM